MYGENEGFVGLMDLEQYVTAKFWLPGKPIPYPRMRKGMYGNMYNPASKELKAARELLRDQAKDFNEVGRQIVENGLILPVTAILSVRVYLFMVPTKRGVVELIKRNGGIPVLHTKRPDADNLLKFVMDAGNGALWEDDEVVPWKVPVKFWAPFEGTLISVTIPVDQEGHTWTTRFGVDFP